MAKVTWSEKERKAIREGLVEERARLEAQRTAIQETTFATDQSEYAGDVSNYGDETADAGTSTFERERDLSLENNLRDLVGKIDRALGRLDDGTFGICERCHKPIEKARVKALPYVELCIKDAQAQSRQR
ncbi:MAG: TraR/DksA family transcriptional regulator [Actinomycetota bacterium]